MFNNKNTNYFKKKKKRKKDSEYSNHQESCVLDSSNMVHCYRFILYSILINCKQINFDLVQMTQRKNAAPETAVLKYGCCYFSALVLTCYHLKKGHATFYWPETIVASLLLFMVLSFKVIFNHDSAHVLMICVYKCS